MPDDNIRDFVRLERRRLAASRLLRKGVTQAEVARRTGVSRQSVSRWAAVLKNEGAVALRRAPRAGRRPRLDAEQHRLMLRLLKTQGEPLTVVRVKHLLERHIGITYQRTKLIALLRGGGFKPRWGVGWVKID